MVQADDDEEQQEGEDEEQDEGEDDEDQGDHDDYEQESGDQYSEPADEIDHIDQGKMEFENQDRDVNLHDEEYLYDLEITRRVEQEKLN